MIFPGTEVEAHQPVVPRVILYPFLKNGFPFFQSSGTSPDSHDFSNMMKSGSATTSAISLRTLGWIWSGLMDLYTLFHEEVSDLLHC